MCISATLPCCIPTRALRLAVLASGVFAFVLLPPMPASALAGSGRDESAVAIERRLEEFRSRVVANEGKAVRDAWVRSGAYHFEFDDGTFGMVLPVDRDPDTNLFAPSAGAPHVELGVADGSDRLTTADAPHDRAPGRPPARSDTPAPQATAYLDANADTYVYSNVPNSALGSMQYLLVGTYGGTSFALVRATPFSIAGTITESQLWAYAESCAGSVPGNASISAHRISGMPDWQEGTTTWQDYPAFQSVAEDTMPTSGCPSGWRAWDITSVANGWNSGTYGNRGIALRYPSGSPTGSAVSFASREGTSGRTPYFYVAYTQPTPCAYSFSPTSANLGAGAGSGSVTVSGSPAGCQGSWSASEGSFWLSLSGSTGGSGAGPFTLGYNYDANTGAARNTTIAFTGNFPSSHSLTLYQAAPAVPDCAYSFSPTSANVGAGAGSGTVTVSGSPSGCQGSWSASDSATWISLSGSTSGSGSGPWTLVYSYDANPGPSARSGQISFGGAFPSGSSFTVDQAAPPSGSCLYEQDFTSNPLWTSLAPAYAYWDSTQGNYYANTYDNVQNAYVGYSPAFSAYDGTSPLTIEFDVMFESPNWGTYPGLRFTPQAVTAANYETNFSFVFLNLYTDSTGNVLYVADTRSHGYTSTNTVVAGLWYHVALAYTGSGRSLDLTIWNKATGAVLTDVNAVDFEIAPFQHVAAGYFGAPDYGSSWSPVRVDNIRICSTTSTPTCSYSFSPTSTTVGAGANIGSISVSGSPSGCQGSWSASDSATWISLSGSTSGSGSGSWTLAYNYDANPGPSARSGQINFSGTFPAASVFTLDQAAPVPHSCSYSFSPTSATVGAGASTGNVSVSGSPSGCQGSWSASDSATWISLSGSTSGSGAGNWTLVYNHAANPGPSTRSAQITFSGGFPAGAVFTVDQAAPTCTTDANTLCLLGSRFRVQVDFRDYAGNAGRARAVPLTSDTGYFWFFDSANVEIVAKMVSFCSGTSGNIGVYAGGLTDVQATLKVFDTATSLYREYSNPLGSPWLLIRDGPFSCSTGTGGGPGGFDHPDAEGGGAATTLGPEPFPGFPLAALPATAENAGPTGTCVPDGYSLCLLNSRFKVEADFRDYAGNRGFARAVTLTTDTGYFWFFSAANVEVVTKMVSFCNGASGNVGIYAGGLTDVEVKLRVTDTFHGTYREYTNPLGAAWRLVRDGPFLCP